MSLLQDWYWKTVLKHGFEIKKFSGVVNTFGTLTSPIVLGDHKIVPFDKERDFNDPNKPQRLKIELNMAVEENAGSYYPPSLIDDISSILALVTGKIVSPGEGFIYEDEAGVEKVAGNEVYEDRHHPNLYSPVVDENIQIKIDKIFSSLINMKTDKDIEKHKAILKALKLYRDSLIILRYDEDTAYMLLVASIEVIGAEFSSIEPTFESFPESEELQSLFTEENFSEALRDKIISILLKPKHLKLRAKFIDIVKSNLSENYFDEPTKIQTRVGKVEDDKVIITGWKEANSNKFMKKEQLDEALKTVYDCRSSFVHSGEEWPLRAKLGSYDLITPIKVDKNNEAVRKPDGTFQGEKALPTYFGFERIVSNVLHNIVYKFGKNVD